MNVFSLLNHFFRENEREKVSSSATKLYFFLIYEANKSYWEGPLMFSERKLSSLLSFSKNTVSKSLSELEDRGLIMCYPRRVNSLTANEEDSLKRPERGSRKGSLTANVKGKEAFSSTFWFPEVQLRKAASNSPKEVQGKTGSQQMRKTASRQMRKTASRQTRNEKKEVYNKGVRYNFHRGENSLTANKEGGLTANKEGSLTANKEGSLTANEKGSLKRPEGGSMKDSLMANKGGSKYAKFF